jgi:hypothetical protein
MFFKKKKQQKEIEPFDYAMKLVANVLEPSFKKQVNLLNEFLKDYDVVVGAEIKWFFEKINKQKE